MAFTSIAKSILLDAELLDEYVRANNLPSPSFDVDGPARTVYNTSEAAAAHASHLISSIEAYRAAARTLRVLLGGALPESDLTIRALSVGRQMFLGGEIDRQEALGRPTIETAWRAFQADGYLERKGDQLGLAPRFRSEDTVRTVEERIVRFIPVRGGSLWSAS